MEIFSKEIQIKEGTRYSKKVESLEGIKEVFIFPWIKPPAHPPRHHSRILSSTA